MVENIPPIAGSMRLLNKPMLLPLRTSEYISIEPKTSSVILANIQLFLLSFNIHY